MEKPKLSGQSNITLAKENRVYLCKEEYNLPQRKTQAALFSSVLLLLLIYSSICTYYVASQVIVLHVHFISSIISFKRQDQVLCIIPGYHTACSVQYSSVAQSCPTLCDPMNLSSPGLPVHHQLPEFTQTHVHQVGDAIQPSHPLSSPSPPAPNPSQHQGLFQ